MDHSKIITYLEGDILQNAPLLAALRRGTGEILAGGEESALLREASGVYMLSATSREAAEEVLEALPACTTLVACQADLADIPARKYGLVSGGNCYQAVYTGGPLPLDDVLTFHAPNEEELDIIDATYDLDDRAGLAKLRDRGMLFAGFAGEEFVGYVGRHREGSVGLLNVFPQYRRKATASGWRPSSSIGWWQRGRGPTARSSRGTRRAWPSRPSWAGNWRKSLSAGCSYRRNDGI